MSTSTDMSWPTSRGAGAQMSARLAVPSPPISVGFDPSSVCRRKSDRGRAPDHVGLSRSRRRHVPCHPVVLPDAEPGQTGFGAIRHRSHVFGLPGGVRDGSGRIRHAKAHHCHRVRPGARAPVLSPTEATVARARRCPGPSRHLSRREPTENGSTTGLQVGATIGIDAGLHQLCRLSSVG